MFLTPSRLNYWIYLPEISSGDIGQNLHSPTFYPGEAEMKFDKIIDKKL